jgi:hypothetical protein
MASRAVSGKRERIQGDFFVFKEGKKRKKEKKKPRGLFLDLKEI